MKNKNNEYDLSFLDKIKEKTGVLDKGLRVFFEKYPTETQQFSGEARDDWGRLVSGRMGVDYRDHENLCNLASTPRGASNIMVFLKSVVGINSFEELEDILKDSS